MMQTTKMCSFLNDNDVMTGEEEYPIHGTLLRDHKLPKLMSSFKGLKVYWDCLTKAKRTINVLGAGKVAIGSLFVTSVDGKSEYGYAFNPPFEFHAWVEFNGLPSLVIDLALPGVILKGLNTSDAVGPFIIGREPLIMAGEPLPWTRYERHYLYDVSQL